MDLLQIVLLTIQIATASSKRYASSSDESIENLLYYKDCQKKPKPKELPPLMALRSPPASEPPRQFECPYPKMCCSLSCNNECGGNNGASSIFGRQSDMSSPMSQNQPAPAPPHQPQLPVQPLVAQRGRRKKAKPNFPPPSGTRREFGFTKEKIKSLISKDEDIRKILKDLVRVTMQKVDLVALINSRKSAAASKDIQQSEISKSDDYDLEME